MPVSFVFSCGRRKSGVLAVLDSFLKETSLESLLWDTKWGSCFILDAKDTCQTPAQGAIADSPSVFSLWLAGQQKQSHNFEAASAPWRPGSYRGRESLPGVLASTQTLLCIPKLPGQKMAAGCCSQTSTTTVEQLKSMLSMPPLGLFVVPQLRQEMFTKC